MNGLTPAKHRSTSPPDFPTAFTGLIREPKHRVEEPPQSETLTKLAEEHGANNKN
jgi:hypothetical protein